MAITFIRRSEAYQAIKLSAGSVDELNDATDYLEAGDLAVVRNTLYVKGIDGTLSQTLASLSSIPADDYTNGATMPTEYTTMGLIIT